MFSRVINDKGEFVKRLLFVDDILEHERTRKKYWLEAKYISLSHFFDEKLFN